MAATAKWWHVEDDVVVCDLCPRECRLHEGQRAFCFVRQNVGGQMVSTTYGLSTGFCIDPIEKKPLNHFLPGTPVLSFGTAGCNLGCKFCQNWDISKSREVERLSAVASPEAIAEAAVTHQCRSVAFTYNDPVIFAEYAIDTARCCHEAGVKTVAVTAGYITPQARADFFEAIDAANVDLKAFTEVFYKHLSFAKLGPVLDTLRWLKHETDVWLEITNLIIPEENDSPEEVARLCDWIVENLGDRVPVHFSAFHPDFRMRHRPRTPHETLIRAREQALRAGISYVYTGNVNDAERQSTYCHACKRLLIQRNWYELGVYQLSGNRCRYCDAEIPGCFEATPGDWGSKRQPIQIRECRASKTHEPPSPAIASSGPRIDFDEAESAAIAKHARALVESVVRGSTPAPVLPTELAEAPAFGAFVTLKRCTLLRACRGRWGGRPTTLGQMLAQVAADTATDDYRFPAIHPRELPLLSVEVSLMYDPQEITVSGQARAAAVEVGTHGLVISHPRGRGLLLPQVATEAGWDAWTFLTGVCRKAGLSEDAWMNPATELMTFRARILHSDPEVTELDGRNLGQPSLRFLLGVVRAHLADSPVDIAGADATLTNPYDHELGLALTSDFGTHVVVTGVGQSLLDLAATAASELRRSGRTAETVRQLSVLWQPLHLLAQDSADRQRLLNQPMIVVQGGERTRAIVPGADSAVDAVQDALAAIGLSRSAWKKRPPGEVTVTAFSANGFVEPVRGGDAVRQPAHAGTFYPGEPRAMRQQLTEYLSAGVGEQRAAHRGVMLPHAGWIYCGGVIAKTLARIRIPNTVVLLCPKHTQSGAWWSVSSADRWDIPGASIPLATDICDRLEAMVPRLECEATSHRQEHAVEVLLPFLHYLNPALQIVPLVVGTVDYPETASLAEALATISAELPEPPLLVISSDMNSFADETENRRLDFLAIDAMVTGDPERLLATVREHDISMCGIMPAVVVMRALQVGHEGPLSVELVEYAHSGQVTGDRRQVVGYAGVLLE